MMVHAHGDTRVWAVATPLSPLVASSLTDISSSVGCVSTSTWNLYSSPEQPPWSTRTRRCTGRPCFTASCCSRRRVDSSTTNSDGSIVSTGARVGSGASNVGPVAPTAGAVGRERLGEERDDEAITERARRVWKARRKDAPAATRAARPIGRAAGRMGSATPTKGGRAEEPAAHEWHRTHAAVAAGTAGRLAMASIVAGIARWQCSISRAGCWEASDAVGRLLRRGGGAAASGAGAGRTDRTCRRRASRSSARHDGWMPRTLRRTEEDEGGGPKLASHPKHKKPARRGPA